MNKKTRPIHALSTRDPLQIERHMWTESKRMEKNISSKWKQKELRQQYLYQTKYFKVKAIIRDKEQHFLMIKGSIQQADKTLVNIYAPNTGAPKYIKQTLIDIKGEIDTNTVIVRDFNTPLISRDRSFRQKINKEMWP